MLAALPYLNSSAAGSAALVGQAVGRLQQSINYRDDILGAAAQAESSLFTRGYLSGLLERDPSHVGAIRFWLDALEESRPDSAYDVCLAIPHYSDPITRIKRMVTSRRLSVATLRAFQYRGLWEKIDDNELASILTLLMEEGTPDASHVAIEFSAQRLRTNEFDARKLSLPLLDSIFEAVDASASLDDRSDHWWARVVRSLASIDSARALRTAITAILGEDYSKHAEGWNLLNLMSSETPELVMNVVGETLLHDERGWKLWAGKRQPLFASLPGEIVIRWLEQNGVEGARAISTHLPTPSIDEHGEAKLNTITAFVLDRWGDDEVVFARFSTGTHNLQMYQGDIAASHDREAQFARKFLGHHIPAIRRWAEGEVAMAESQAKSWRIRDEERFLR